MHKFGRLSRFMKYYSSKKHVILALLTALFVGILFYNSKAPVYGDTMKSGVVKCSSIDTVNTRTEPSINSEIINKLANGKTVFILEEVAGNDNHTWYYVSYNLDANGESKTGYIRSDYVTVGDNSLQTLSINPGTLSPEFSYDTTRYTASVDYNVTSVEVSAIPTDENSQVVGISGNENLAVGENTIEVDIQASNGVIAAYYIDVTRQEEAAQVSGSATTSSGTGMSAGEMYELQVNYQKLTEDYEALQQTHKITIIVMGAVILILAILLIFMFFRSGRMDEEFDEDDEYDEDEQNEDEALGALDELDEDEEREELAEPEEEEEPEVTSLEPDDTAKQPPVHVEVIDIHRDTPADMKSAMEELAVEEADSVVEEIAAAEAKSVMEEMVAAKADSVIEEIAAAEAKSAMEEITAVKTTPVVEERTTPVVESTHEESTEVELSLEEALLRNALAEVMAEDKPEEKPEQEHPEAYEEELREEPEEEYKEELQEEPEEEYEEEEPEEEYEEEASKKKSFWGMLKSLSDVFEEEDLDDYDEVRHVEPEEDAEEDSDEEVDESAFADEFEDEFARGRAKKEKKAAKKSKKDSKKGSVTTEEEDDDLEFLDL